MVHWTKRLKYVPKNVIAIWFIDSMRLLDVKDEKSMDHLPELMDRFVLLHLKAEIISGTGRLFFSLSFLRFLKCKEKLKKKKLREL
jgi:hypothetical protein